MPDRERFGKWDLRAIARSRQHMTSNRNRDQPDESRTVAKIAVLICSFLLAPSLLTACGRATLGQGSAASSAATLSPVATSPAITAPQAAPLAAPEARIQPTVVYDGVSRQLLLFGGIQASGQFQALGDTWARGDKGWSVAGLQPGPSARAGAVAAFDPVRKTVVLFGGRTNSYRVFSDTWLWNGSAWAQQTPTKSPNMGPERGTFTFDLARGEAILFANNGLTSNDGAGPITYTWAWTGNDWAQKVTASSPPFRWGAAMAYDGTSRTVVLFGGYQTEVPGGVLGDTWLWNGVTWTQAAPSSSPLAGPAYAAYDEVGKRLWLLTIDGAMWSWSANNWTRQGTYSAVAHRINATMLFDGAIGKIVLHGGAARHSRRTISGPPR